MIDREARDWLADLVARAIAGEFDPGASPDFLQDERCESKDRILEEGSEHFAQFCGGKHQMNAWGTFPMIINVDDETRRMRNLLTFLKSDIEFKEEKLPWWAKWGCLGVILFPVMCSPIFGAKMSAEDKFHIFIGIVTGCYGFPFMVLYFAGFLVFAFQRWVRPPEPATDVSDPWPFKTVEELVMERTRQEKWARGETSDSSS